MGEGVERAVPEVGDPRSDDGGGGSLADEIGMLPRDAT
jgi:hypothetical protein